MNKTCQVAVLIDFGYLLTKLIGIGDRILPTRHASQAIAALKGVAQLDAQNPYAYAYLAFLS
jgi:hypothetical protein